MTHQEECKQKSLEPIRRLVDKKQATIHSIAEFLNKSIDAKIGLQLNLFNGTDHICIGFSHPNDVAKLTGDAVDLLEKQIEYFNETLNE